MWCSNTRTALPTLRRTLGLRAIFAALAVLVTIAPTAAAQVPVDVLHEFTGHSAPSSPSSPLILASDGNFYGVTSQGGAFSFGTLFRITPAGELTVLHDFNNRPDGIRPLPLLQASDGSLYGTTNGGGSSGGGTVFRMTLDGTYSILHSFSGVTIRPNAGLIQATDGNLYGTSSAQNASGSGIVFRITPSGDFTIIYSFGNAAFDGDTPDGPVIQAVDGNLYGTTSAGGQFGFGVVYRLSLSGAGGTIHSFTGGTSGGNPSGDLTKGSDGSLYGRARGGDFEEGVIYRVNGAGSFAVIHSFTSLTGGAATHKPLCLGTDGNFYGVTTDFPGGVVFRLTPTGEFTALYTFTSVASSPEPHSARHGLVEAPDGSFYGVTTDGGLRDVGTVFAITKTGDLTTVYPFPGNPDGAGPNGPLVEGIDGRLYGTTNGGGRFDAGTLFATTKAGETTILHTFGDGAAKDGTQPDSLIQASDGYLYGITRAGGEWDLGTVFRSTYDGVVTTLHHFTGGADGWWPSAIIQTRDGSFVGTTEGGACSFGCNTGGRTAFRMDLSGTITTFHVFQRGQPISALIESTDNNFYGMLSLFSGSGTQSAIYALTPQGDLTVLRVVDTYAGEYGGPPLYGGLLEASNGSLYGMHPDWGAGRAAPIFKIKDDGSFIVLGRLPTDEEDPLGSFIEAPDGYVYGQTSARLFRFPLNGPFVLQTLSEHELGSLLLADDGYLYGTTSSQIVRFRVPMPKMSLDVPQSSRTVSQPFVVAGWTFDFAAGESGVGIDTVHVWASPLDGGAPQFLGVADYGLWRPDVGAVFGERFTPSGFSLRVQSLGPGTYRLSAHGHSTATGTFTISRTATVTVRSPTSLPRVQIDAPVASAVVGSTFTVAGWAIDAASPDDPGVDAVHVYAYPASGGPIFLGAAAVGGSRPDVAAAFGAQFAHAGYGLAASGLPPGAYRLVVFAHSTITGIFTAKVQNITVRPPGNPQMALDTPAGGATLSVPFIVAGWALDADADTGTGVDTIHVWAFPASSAAPLFLGVASYDGDRPDVGAIFGPGFTASGYGLRVTTLAPGQYQIVVFAHSSVTGSFSQARSVAITVF